MAEDDRLDALYGACRRVLSAPPPGHPSSQEAGERLMPPMGWQDFLVWEVCFACLIHFGTGLVTHAAYDALKEKLGRLRLWRRTLKDRPEDAAARKEAEQALREARAEAEAVIAQTPLSVSEDRVAAARSDVKDTLRDARMPEPMAEQYARLATEAVANQLGSSAVTR